ncbi:hypothetical protein [Saccharomonospora viridis]|uniref:Uncharacterized protein n=2 Tax=Saccharomonospora viridis TaxID=1852 RepID=C7MUE4_SACVD|nr:hypothetical protein [Saccharomonospora viridis]ACU96923.1 hypothetical protein Svir_19010 [Saccharomonospora viridis DSM 43017]KHF43136.1 hypothetical protein MINT15_33380 [Saccharomonospora viridis]
MPTDHSGKDSQPSVDRVSADAFHELVESELADNQLIVRSVDRGSGGPRQRR